MQLELFVHVIKAAFIPQKYITHRPLDTMDQELMRSGPTVSLILIPSLLTMFEE